MHAKLTARDFFLANFYPSGPFICIFVLSKVTEKVVLSQLSTYLSANKLFPVSQPAYRPGHSTETALLKLINDLHVLDDSDVSLLTLLELSAAFDTIEHNVLLQRLEHLYGISKHQLTMEFLVYL